MQMWQIGLATGAGALMLANPVQAASNGALVPYSGGAEWALLVVAGLALFTALSRRRREGRVFC